MSSYSRGRWEIEDTRIPNKRRLMTRNRVHIRKVGGSGSLRSILLSRYLGPFTGRDSWPK